MNTSLHYGIHHDYVQLPMLLLRNLYFLKYLNRKKEKTETSYSIFRVYNVHNMIAHFKAKSSTSSIVEVNILVKYVLKSGKQMALEREIQHVKFLGL